jgi:D-alanyl-D-alanine carboxypeptidase
MRRQLMSLFISAAVVLATAAGAQATTATAGPPSGQPSTTSTATATPFDRPGLRPTLHKADLAAILASHHAAGEFVGARVALLDRDGTITQAVAGRKATSPGSQRVDLDVPWGIGSITKALVAVVVLQLAEEGRIHLDAGISDYLPHLKDADLITPRQLLQHTSGLNEYLNQPTVDRHLARPWTAAELIAVAERAGRLSRPGGPYHYSNTNYIVLGEIVEQVTGSSWLEAVRQRIIEPLGMGKTDLISPDSPRGYDLGRSGFVEASRWNPSVGGAAGALESTPRDLLKFAAALRDGSLLDHESQAAMRTFVPGEDYSAFGVVNSYGLGLERYRAGAVTVLGHLGSSDAHSGFVGFDPRSGTAVAVQMNSTNGGPQVMMAIEILTAAHAAHRGD